MTRRHALKSPNKDSNRSDSTRESSSSNEDALLNAAAVVGLSALLGGALGTVFAAPCTGQSPLCGSFWGAIEGVGVAEGLVALVGGALATLRPKDKTGVYMASAAGVVTGIIAVAAAVRGKQPAPPPAATQALPANGSSVTL